MEKSKAKKVLGWRKRRKPAQRRKKKLHFVNQRKTTLPKATKALGLAKRLRQARQLVKIRSVRKPFWHGFCLCLYLWRLCPLLGGRPELNCTERYKKKMLQCGALPGKSWSVVIDTRKSWFFFFFHWFGVLLGVIISEHGTSCWENFTSQNLAFAFWRNTPTLSEIIGYVDLTDCREISPEHSRDNDKPKCVGKCWYLSHFSLWHLLPRWRYISITD